MELIENPDEEKRLSVSTTRDIRRRLLDKYQREGGTNSFDKAAGRAIELYLASPAPTKKKTTSDRPLAELSQAELIEEMNHVHSRYIEIATELSTRKTEKG